MCIHLPVYIYVSLKRVVVVAECWHLIFYFLTYLLIGTYVIWRNHALARLSCLRTASPAPGQASRRILLYRASDLIRTCTWVRFFSYKSLTALSDSSYVVDTISLDRTYVDQAPDVYVYGRISSKSRRKYSSMCPPPMVPCTTSTTVPLKNKLVRRKFFILV